MEALTPASPDDLPPIGELIVDEPFWRHPAWGLSREGVAHLRIWTAATDSPGHVAVVTETGFEDSVTESAGRIWAELTGPRLVRRHMAATVCRIQLPLMSVFSGMAYAKLALIARESCAVAGRCWQAWLLRLLSAAPHR